MKIILFCLVTCSIAFGQILEKLSENVEHQNQILLAIHSIFYHQFDSLRRTLMLIDKKIEDTKKIEQETDSPKKIEQETDSAKNETINQALKELEDRLDSILDSLKNRTNQGKVCPESTNHTNSCDEVNGTNHPTSCKEVNRTKSGLYYIRIKAVSEEPFEVFCDQGYDNGGWTVIQRRINNSTDFYLPWPDYQNGFGDLRGNFWIGLDKLHLITSDRSYKLAILLGDFDGNGRQAKYDRFVVGSEKEGYSLERLGDYTGSAGDSLSDSKGMRFSTYDKDNDKSSNNCAENNKGAWWYNDCSYSNLNGPYLGPNETEQSGLFWYHINNSYKSLKFTQMMISPIY